MTSTVATNRKSPGNVECLISAYRIRFEQAEEHTRLTNKEERKTMKKRRMKTETITHYMVDLSKNECSIDRLGPVYREVGCTLVILGLNQHAAKCAEIR